MSPRRARSLSRPVGRPEIWPPDGEKLYVTGIEKSGGISITRISPGQ